MTRINKIQTFLPYPDFIETAKCLDYRRLGKQRIESKQIIDILEGNVKSNAWKNHPAVKMWKGYENCLKYYFNKISEEWTERGYKHNMGYYFPLAPYVEYPPWFKNEEFHLSHQSNLIRKFPEHYSEYFPNVPNDLPYVWPIG